MTENKLRRLNIIGREKKGLPDCKLSYEDFNDGMSNFMGYCPCGCGRIYGYMSVTDLLIRDIQKIKRILKL